MGRPAGWMKELTGRSPMKSPGKPSLRRDVERWFWRRDREGAQQRGRRAGRRGVAGGWQPVVSRAWRHGDVPARPGLVPVLVLCGARGDCAAAGRGQGRARDRATAWSFAVDDLPGAAAQRGHAWRQAGVPGVGRAVEGGADGSPAKDREARRQRAICASTCRNGSPARSAGPTGRRWARRQPWKGRNRPRRQDRRWATAWSPEQIANRLQVDFPDDESMRDLARGDLPGAVCAGPRRAGPRAVACLRTGRALRVPRARTGGRGKGFVSDEMMISQRPAEAADRAVPGHWEGDLILGIDRSAIGTLVERTSRFTMLLHLPPVGERDAPRIKNGPPVTGARRRSGPRRDRRRARRPARAAAPLVDLGPGRRDGRARQARIDSGLQVYFCDPQSPWQRGTNENTNGLLRQYFPKGTDLGPPQPRGPGRRRRRAQRPAAQDARMADPRRGPGRAPGRGALSRPRPTTAPGPKTAARVAIAAPARPPGDPPRRQPRGSTHPLSSQFHPLRFAHQ